MAAAAIDSSGDLNFIAIVYGEESEPKRIQTILSSISPLHMREIGKARRLRLAENFLNLLKHRRSIKVICLHTGSRAGKAAQD